MSRAAVFGALCAVALMMLLLVFLRAPPRIGRAPNTYLGVVPRVAAEWESDYLELLLEKTSGKTVYTFNSNVTSFDEAESVVRSARPDVVIHLADEGGLKPEFNRLAELCPLLLRQHDHPGYPAYANLYHIPLGFMKGMFPSGSPPPTRGPRSRVWSFVGDSTKNAERHEMVAALRTLRPYFLGNASAEEMAEIYTDSEFVPSVRGNVVMDCFRLYEASACGAVPVMVGPAQECAPLLARMRDPPWMVFESWDEAVPAMRALRAQPAALRERGDTVREWWWREVRRFQKLLAR